MAKKLAVNVPKDMVPPQNLDAELSLLGAILIDKDASFKVLDIITPEDFYRPNHSLIFEGILRLIEKRQPVDVLTLSDQLEKMGKLEEVGGASFLSDLVSGVSSAANIASYAQIIKNSATLRRLIGAGSEIVELGFTTDAEIDVLIDQAEKTLFAASNNFLKGGFTPIQDILSGTFERIDELHKQKGKIQGVPTGFKELDNLLAGLQNSDLVIIAARPSMGKTTLALNIAASCAIKEKISVGIFSLEQSKDQLVDRMLVAEASVDSWKLRTGNLSDDDFPRIGYAMGVLSEAPIYIDDSPLLNIMEMRAKARRLQAEKGLGLVIVDYLQLMMGRSHGGDFNRVQEISEISRGLKAIARELNIPVIALSQLSRAVEMRPSKIPQLADLRESGCLASDSLILDTGSGKLNPINNLVRNKPPIRPLSVNLRLKLNSTCINNGFYTGFKPIFKITTASGKTIKATANHKFLTLAGWMRLDQLLPGNHLATPRIINYLPEGPVLNDDQLILLGHLIGDGCTLSRQPIHYTNADLVCHDVVSGAAKRQFSIIPRLIAQKNWYHTYLPSPYQLARGRRNPIAKWFDELGVFNLRAKQKIIPEVIFSQPLGQIAVFLRHLFATDGSITRSNFGWRLYYASNSLTLIRQLQHLLLRFGIIGRIKQSQKESYHPTYSLDIYGKEHQLEFCQKIGIFGQKNAQVARAIKELARIKSNPNKDIIPKQIWHSIEKERQKHGWTTREFHRHMDWAYSGTMRHQNGLSRVRLQKVAQKLESDELLNLASSDIYWDEINAIEPAGEDHVYDLTINDTHNFVANDFIVHNSIEQDADVVTFIYRDDYYDPESEKKNIADLFVKKHRNGPTGSVELFFIPEQMKFATIERARSENKTPIKRKGDIRADEET